MFQDKLKALSAILGSDELTQKVLKMAEANEAVGEALGIESKEVKPGTEPEPETVAEETKPEYATKEAADALANLVTTLKETVDSLKSDVEALKAADTAFATKEENDLAKLKGVVDALIGEAPRGVLGQGFRASTDEGTITDSDSLKGKSPQRDPLFALVDKLDGKQ